VCHQVFIMFSHLYHTVSSYDWRYYWKVKGVVSEENSHGNHLTFIPLSYRCSYPLTSYLTKAAFLIRFNFYNDKQENRPRHPG